MTADEILETVHNRLDQPLENLGLLAETQLRLQGKGFATVRQVVSSSRASIQALLRNGRETGNRRMRDLEGRLHEFCPFLEVGMNIPKK